MCGKCLFQYTLLPFSATNAMDQDQVTLIIILNGHKQTLSVHEANNNIYNRRTHAHKHTQSSNVSFESYIIHILHLLLYDTPHHNGQ